MIHMSELSDALKECGALQFGEFTLASGAKSDYYINIKKASTDPKVLGLIARLMADKVRENGIEADRIAGVVLGAVPLEAALALETGLPFVMVRKEKKDHGTGKQIEGDLNAGESILMVEDVVTTAGSCVKGIQVLREAGADVKWVLSVIDREAGGAEALEAEGVRFIPLVKGSELLGER